MSERDGEACLYEFECEPGKDIRKRLFMLLAERGWPMIGLEAIGMSLEDIFINIVDGGIPSDTGKSRRKYEHDERAVAREIMAKTAEAQKNSSDGSAD